MIELKNISRTYRLGKTGVPALRGVTLTIRAGEFVAIMGPSGSGKSTLMHILGFLDRPDTGSYLLNNREISRLGDDQLAGMRNRLVGFVFQQFHLLAHLSALQNAELPLVYAGCRSLKEQAHVKLDEVGLSRREEHRPNELSGGEQQRVAIARSLVNEPLIILADEPTGNLDTASGEEVISILEKLNQKGKTVIVVTHEREIAEHAGRVIHMRDGVIVSDESTKADERKSGPFPLEPPPVGLAGESHSTGSKAVFADHLRQALHSVFSHKMRSFLSMLGILIGVAAVIAMLALGQGAKKSIAKQLASLGSNLLTIRSGSQRMHGVALEAGSVTRLTLQDAQALARLPQIAKISASVTGRSQLVYGNKNWNTQVQGADVDYAEMRASVPTAGRFLTEDEVRKREKVAVIGTTIARELFGDANPVGATLKINRINFRVIGVLPEKGSSGWHDRDDIVLVPITTAMYRLLGKEYVNSIDVEVKEPSLMQEAEDAIRKVVVKRHHLGPEKKDSFQIRNMAEIQETLQSTTKTMGWLLGSIAAISLLVGGIGIMNIMLVSVAERTREIGLRKAIGALRKDIMVQFLIEAVLMTFSGGVTGVILGAAVSALLSALAGWTVQVTVFAILLATTFSIAVGLAFGVFPARQAARLDPIEALRYE